MSEPPPNSTSPRRAAGAPPLSIGTLHDGTPIHLPRSRFSHPPFSNNDTTDNENTTNNENTNEPPPPRRFTARKPVPLRLAHKHPSSPRAPPAPPTTPATAYWNNAPLPPSPRWDRVLEVPLPETPVKPWLSPVRGWMGSGEGEEGGKWRWKEEEKEEKENDERGEWLTLWGKVVHASALAGYAVHELSFNLPHHISTALISILILALSAFHIPLRRITHFLHLFPPTPILLTLFTPLLALALILVSADTYILVSDPTFFRFHFAPARYASFGALEWAAGRDVWEYPAVTAPWMTWRKQNKHVVDEVGWVEAEAVLGDDRRTGPVVDADLRGTFREEALHGEAHSTKVRVGEKIQEVFDRIKRAYMTLTGHFPAAIPPSPSPEPEPELLAPEPLPNSTPGEQVLELAGHLRRSLAGVARLGVGEVCESSWGRAVRGFVGERWGVDIAVCGGEER